MVHISPSRRSLHFPFLHWHNKIMNNSNNRADNNNSSRTPTLTASMSSCVEETSSARERMHARTISLSEYFTKWDMCWTVTYMCSVGSCKRSFGIWLTTSTLRSHPKDHVLHRSRPALPTKMESLLNEEIELTQPRQRDFLLLLRHLTFDVGFYSAPVEHSYFSDMIASLDHQLKVPCHTTVSQEMEHVPESHYSLK